MTSSFHSAPVMTKVTFAQDEDTSSDRATNMVSQEIEVETVYVAPAERYFVLKTERWAFNDIAELVEMLKKGGCE